MKHSSEPVTVIFERIVRPGKEAAYRIWYQQLIALSQQQPGHLDTQVIEQGRRCITVQKFASARELDAWLESDTRHTHLQQINDLTEKAPEPTVYTGLETWFTLPEDAGPMPIPRWKMALVMMCAVYALVLLLNIFLMPYIKDWPVVLRSLPFPIIIVTMLTYVIMPRVTRWLKAWLHK